MKLFIAAHVADLRYKLNEHKWNKFMTNMKISQTAKAIKVHIINLFYKYIAAVDRFYYICS